MQVAGESVELFDRAAGDRFHRSVIPVPHPTADARERCGVLGERAVADALDPPPDDETAGASCLSFCH